jgi:2-dehydro-3-deoxy-L-rhamnonate dehydrogenase (NAD+)
MSLYANRFRGRNAVITGGASGLGFAVARRIVEEGGKVMLWDRDTEAASKAKAQLGAAHSIELDVSDADAVAKAAEATVAALGKVDILVNSAGITGATVPVHEFPIDSWLKVMSINLNGLFYCCRALVPHMLANSYGRIVNVASVAGKEGNPNASAYSASKAGVIGFTKSLGKELATRRIMVNAITPAAFESPLFAQMPQNHIDYMRSKIPMGRFGELAEVAAMICFMASEECSFTTASTFDTSGGRTTY